MFMLGEPKLVGYNGYTPDDKHLEYKLFVDNNILYTVELDEDNGIELKENEIENIHFDYKQQR